MKVKVNCLVCGKEFEIPSSAIKWGQGKFCSRKCFFQAKRKRTIRVCQCCGKEFEIKTYRIKYGQGKFCSKKCYGEWISQYRIGEKAINWKGGLPHCMDCGKKLSTHYSKRCEECNHKFHSREKHWNWKGGKRHNYCIDCGKEINLYKNAKRCRSCASVGEKNGRWQGGKSFEEYSLEWTKELKEQIRKRDNYTCQKCGKIQEQEFRKEGRKLSVHHIDYNKKNCSPENLITLCRRCHSKVNNARIWWQGFFIGRLYQKNLGLFR